MTAVSKADIIAGGYHRIVIFVQNASNDPPWDSVSFYRPYKKDEIVRQLISRLGEAGVTAVNGDDFFKNAALTNQEKASEIQKKFEGVLYVDVIVNGLTEEQVKDAHQNGQFIWWGFGDPDPIDDSIRSTFDLRPDGTVWQYVPTLQTKSDLQDTRSAKEVWIEETTATGGSLVLLVKATNQLVNKMHADGVI